MPEHSTKRPEAGAVRPWLKHYPPGLSWDAPIATCQVQHILDEAVAAYPARVAIEFEGRAFTYAELGSLADRAAQGLRALGVAPGVPVGLYLPNTPHYALAFFAVLKAGGTVVNFSPLDAADVVRHKIADSQTEIVITLDLPALYPMMASMLGSTRLRRLVVGSLADMGMRGPPAESPGIAFDDSHIRFQDLIANDGAPLSAPPADLEEAIAVLQYTGGTTGLPKGAVLSHAMLSAACSQALLNTRHDDGMRLGQEIFLCVLPLFHIYALTFNLLLALRLGATTILHQRFEPERAIAEIAERRVTVFFGVPTMFTALNACALLDTADLSSLRFCNSGGAPLAQEAARRFREAAGQIVLEGWGMTELCGVGTITPRGTVGPPGACGIPLCGVDIRFLDVNDPGRTVPYGERGEICVAGPNVLRRYWLQPQASADAMTADGYFRTGDVGYMDADGYLHISDRVKDMLLCSGYNVYPRLIEEAVYRHPSVVEVIVIGVDDPYRGQHPKAFIRLRDGAAPFTLEALKLFLKDALGKHEMVQAIEFRAALPKTAVGKLSKKELYEEERARRQQAGPTGAP
ncbi:AMP-binding protein [Noviherbaspirillum soli]|uniref:AMP-binding protein n=1 Tax=Noviherbaspirillum soli TaxID=1064518 RepID=UPI00188D13BC|nr:AMP-binding protein [Noviherbaspirillum soli]